MRRCSSLDPVAEVSRTGVSGPKLLSEVPKDDSS
jgi:hypothetical protein